MEENGPGQLERNILLGYGPPEAPSRGIMLSEMLER